MSDTEKSIKVEIFSHPEAERLRTEMYQIDDYHSQREEQLIRRIDGLHRLVHEMMDVLGSIRNKR